MYNSQSISAIIHYLAAVLFCVLAGLDKDPNDQPDIKDFNSWITLAEKERQKGKLKYICIC